MALVWRAKMKTSEKMVLLKLADHADDDGENAWPSVPTMQAQCGMGRSTVQRHLASLQEQGLIKLTREGGGRRKPNCYRVELDAVWAIRLPARSEADPTVKSADGEAVDASQKGPISGRFDDSSEDLKGPRSGPFVDENSPNAGRFKPETAPDGTLNRPAGGALTILNHPFSFTEEFVEGLTLHVDKTVPETDAQIWRTACAAAANVWPCNAVTWNSWWQRSGLARRDGADWHVVTDTGFTEGRLRDRFENKIVRALEGLTKDKAIRLVIRVKPGAGEGRNRSNTNRRAG